MKRMEEEEEMDNKMKVVEEMDKRKKEEGLTDWEHGPPLKITDHDFKNFFKFW